MMSSPHFVMVHGAEHGAWCWYKLENMLREGGFKATSIDLKGAGIDLTDPNTVSSLDEYNQPLYAFLSNLPHNDKVILVGHSIGGGSITAAMCKFPGSVSMAVYVAAEMVKPGIVVPQKIQNIFLGALEEYKEGIWGFIYGNGPDQPATSMMMKPEYIRDKFYNQSPAEDYTLATRLLRPAPVNAFLGVMDIPAAPEIDSIPRVYVKTGKDHLFSPLLQEVMVALWPPSQQLVLQESDHCAFFSVPDALYASLVQAASSVST